MGEPIKPPGVPDWMWAEVSDYDLPFTTPPATILDLGANVGAFTALAQQRWPHALIHAYEPTNVAFLAAGPNVTLHRAAVRSFDGEREIYLGDRSVTNSFHQLGRQTATTAPVHCEHAANLPPAEFIKIDTEGCETEIFAHLDLTDTKVVAVEYHRVEDAEILTDMAEQNGFSVHQEKPLGPTWGLLMFAKPGALRSAAAPKRRKVFIALPVYGGVDPFFMQSLLGLINNPPCDMMLRLLPGDSLVARARNTLTADFLASDCTHLLFIDTDLIFSGDHVKRLLDFDEPVVGGMYPKKQDGPVNWVCNAALPSPPPRADGLQQVRYMGTGFLRVARQVFVQMIERYGDALRYAPDNDPAKTQYDFWSCGVYRHADGYQRYLSEDWFFCQRWLDLGGQVWADTRTILKHVGTAVYPLKSQEQQIFGTPLPTTSTDTAGSRVLAPAIPAEPLT